MDFCQASEQASGAPFTPFNVSNRLNLRCDFGRHFRRLHTLLITRQRFRCTRRANQIHGETRHNPVERLATLKISPGLMTAREPFATLCTRQMLCRFTLGDCCQHKPLGVSFKLNVQLKVKTFNYKTPPQDSTVRFHC